MAALLAFESGGDPDNDLDLSWTVDWIERLGVRGSIRRPDCNNACCVDADNRIVYLDLHGRSDNPLSGFAGSLIDLADMTGLTYLRLGHTAVNGPLAGIAGLTSMGNLDLSGTAVTGSLADLSRMTGMTDLRLFDTAISGRLADLAGITGMTDLRLDGTAITGSLADLSRMTSLEELYLFDMVITGSLADLAGMTGMTHLYIIRTGVTGSLADISGMAFMKELYLTQTRVTGSLADIFGMALMQELYLAGTAVSGDSVALRAAIPRLEDFEFTSCINFPCGSDIPCITDPSDPNGVCGGGCSDADATLLRTLIVPDDFGPMAPQMTATCIPCLTGASTAQFDDPHSVPFPDVIAADLALCAPTSAAPTKPDAPTSCTTAPEFTAFSNLVTTTWYIPHFAHFTTGDLASIYCMTR